MRAPSYHVLGEPPAPRPAYLGEAGAMSRREAVARLLAAHEAAQAATASRRMTLAEWLRDVFVPGRAQ